MSSITTTSESTALTPAESERRALFDVVASSLLNAERATARLQRSNTRLTVAAIASSGLCTLFAGMTAAQGPLVGEGPRGWRLACTISAVLAFVATFCLGLSQQLRLGDQLTTAYRCVGRLRSLGTIIMALSRSWDEIAAEYAELEQAFPEYCRPPRWPHPAPTPPWPPPLPLRRP